MPNLYPLVLATTVFLDLRNGDCFQRFVQFVSPEDLSVVSFSTVASLGFDCGVCILRLRERCVTSPSAPFTGRL